MLGFWQVASVRARVLRCTYDLYVIHYTCIWMYMVLAWSMCTNMLVICIRHVSIYIHLSKWFPNISKSKRISIYIYNVILAILLLPACHCIDIFSWAARHSSHPQNHHCYQYHHHNHRCLSILQLSVYTVYSATITVPIDTLSKYTATMNAQIQLSRIDPKIVKYSLCSGSTTTI